MPYTFAHYNFNITDMLIGFPNESVSQYLPFIIYSQYMVFSFHVFIIP